MKKQMFALIAAVLFVGVTGCQEAKPQFEDGELYMNEAESVANADIDAVISRYDYVEKRNFLEEFKENMGMKFTEFVGKIPAEFNLTDIYSLSLPEPDSEEKVYTLHDYIFEFDSESGKKVELSVSPFGVPAYDIIVKSDSPVHCTLNGATVTGYKFNDSDYYAFMYYSGFEYIIQAENFTEDEFEAFIVSLTNNVSGVDVVLSNNAEDISDILSPADSKFFTELIADESRYIQTMPNCLMDCRLNVDGVEMQYHSDCGNLVRWDNGKCITLTEEEKILLNGIFEKYITLGSGNSEDIAENDINSEGPSAPNTVEIVEQPTDPEPVEVQPTEPAPVQPVAHINWGISFDVENVSPTGLTLVCTQEKGVVFGDFTTGQAYVLEVKGMYDWEEVKPIIDEIYWNEIAYLINVNGVTKWEIDWSKLYGELPVGEYRIYKEVCGHINMVDTGIRKFYGFFEIGEPPVPVVDDKWGIKFEASEATPTGIKLGIMQYGGEHPEYSYLLDNSFWIEKYVDGKWEFVPYIIDEVAWPESLNQINNSSFSLTVNWNYYYGELPAGKYRYCRNIVVYGVVESGSNETVTLEKPYYAEFEIVDPWGVTLSVKNVTPESLTVICEQNGGVEAELFSGSFYTIQKLDGISWVDVEYLPHEYDIAWTSEAWIIPENSKVEWQVNWAWLYGQLAPGKYRIGKEIMYFRGTGDYDKKMYYAEFEIK